jgi:large subunit ribosomal protein L32e
MVNPRKKPKFLRQGARYLRRVRGRWRRPRGLHSKLKKKEKSKGVMPSVGYGAPKKMKGLHPSGLREVLIHNVDDLSRIDREKEAVRIAHTVGKRKRNLILEKAEELGIRVLNP